MDEFSELIPELKQWNNNKGIDVESWIGCVGDFEKAIGYSVIFWPEFKEIDGYIVRSSTNPENLKSFIQKCGNEKYQIEALINHLHLLDLHHWGCPSATPERLSYLGRVLKEIYECKLNRDFPDRSFKVELYSGDSENLEGYEITFYQVP